MWIAPERRSLSRWAVPGLVLGAGVVVGAVLAADERYGTALIAFAALACYAGYLAFRRNEPALPVSERFGTGHRARTHLRASAMTGDVLTIAVIGGLVVQALRGGDITAYVWLAAVAGVTYLLSALIGGRGL
ncbi:ABC transporter permease [Actinomadura napierensis]|uniref:ABC transporter permease n=1 Tax=Actinomadura napierensis TaxID=267854 RepID=A0ABN3A7F4_9ACTN